MNDQHLVVHATRSATLSPSLRVIRTPDGMNTTELHRIASRQHGAIGHSQLTAMGFRLRDVRVLVNRGILHPAGIRTYVTTGSPDTLEQRITLATLIGPGRGLASHRTAAFLWDAVGPEHPWPFDVILPGRTHHRTSTDVIVHSPRDHRNIAPIQRRGIRTTCATRTLIDLAAVHEPLLRSAAERMLLAGHIRRDRLVAAVAQHSRHGRHGIGAVRTLLSDWPYGEKVAESVFELKMQHLLAGTDLDGYETQVDIGPFRVDLAWSRWKVILECDGWGKVDSAEHMRKWARRDSYLQSRGWYVIHVTWAELARTPGIVLREIRTALSTRGWRPEPVSH